MTDSTPVLDGSKIKKRRDELDISQERMAAQCGISFFTLLNIEKNRRDPKLSTVVSIARHLGCRVDDLLKDAS